MEMSISGLLSMEKSLRERKNQLTELAKENSSKTFWEDKNKREEPVYDVRELDKKVVLINNALFKIDQLIKASNATTIVNMDVNFDELMSAIL